MPLFSDKLSFESKLQRYLFIAAIIPTAILMLTFWQFNVSIYLSLLTLLLLTLLIAFCAYNIQHKTSYQLRSLTNLLIGISEDDYSMRGIAPHANDALGGLIQQINSLTDTLAEHRFIAHESQLLVTKIIQHIDVAIIAIDQHKQIALLNPAGEKLLATSQNNAVGKPLAYFNASELLTVNQQQLVKLSFTPQQGNYQVIHDHYREQGQQHDLYFITNVHGLLREHERQAWQNLIRVLSHEINNSLSPIASLSSTLKTQATKQQLDDMYTDNLSIISQRANGLKDFIGSYRQLSTLPEPQKKTANLNDILIKLTPLFPHRELEITNSLSQEIMVDIVQIEQVLINLIKNADEAMQAVESNVNAESTADNDVKKQRIKVIIKSAQKYAFINIIDSGTGIKNNDNLFTPFYSTKQKGSGIGLLLSRQIVEAHGGYISLKNREETKGCIVEISIPL